MRNCTTCGDAIPESMRGEDCPDCLRRIIVGSILNDECDDVSDDFDDCEDAFEAHKDDDPVTYPEDGDIVTSDYMKFYEHGRQHKGPVVECREGERWAHAVMAYCDDEKFWPNIWYIGERGDADLIDMFEALHSEDDS